MSHRFLSGSFLIGLVAMARVVSAETGTFDVTLSGLKAGVLSYSGEESNGRYAATGAVRAAGIASLVMEAQVDTTSKGRVSGNDYRPEAYTETGERKGKQATATYTYRGGVPAITRTPPRSRPPKHGVPPEGQAGTLDPMTTAFAMLRDRPRDLACALNVDLYDGARRSNIRYVEARDRDGGGIACRGEYRRVAGFSPKEMAEKPVWPFTVTYAPAGAVMRVTEVEVPTSFGTLRMRRR